MTAVFTTQDVFLPPSNETPQKLRRQQVCALSDAFDISGSYPEGFLADVLPFRRLNRSIPTRIEVYITRREADPDSGTITNQPGVHSLEPDVRPISRTKDFERSYQKADGTLKREVDSIVEDIRNRFEHQTWKGKGVGPKDTQYIDVTSSKRLVVQIDATTKEVTLLDFGSHDLPRKYGLSQR